MHLDKFSNPIFNDIDLFELIYKGDIDEIFNVPVIKNDELTLLEEHSYNTLTQHIEPAFTTISDFDTYNQKQWMMSDEYFSFDILDYCLSKCSTTEQLERVCEEYVEYEKRNMIIILQWSKYFVDTCTNNNVLWGVGRGSSVASYILYLIGVHRIDSMKYNLEWQEFLRKE